MVATPAAEPTSHDVELTCKALFSQFSPQLRDVPAALLQSLIKVVGVGINDAGTWAPLGFGEDIGS
jgi:hypothetical protein